jgi:hypothetical protein
MSGFLAAKERCENMNRRLENYRKSSLNANHASMLNKTAFIPEPTFERVGSASEHKPRKSEIPVGNAPKQKQEAPAVKNNLFGIELTRDNCLIMALIFILIKEKAEMPLIAALIFLLL